MSAVPEQIHQQLAQLLQGLQSPNNVERTSAEESLNNDWIVSRPELLLMGLAEQSKCTDAAKGQETATTRSFAAVLFRRMATKTRKNPADESATDLFMGVQKDHRDAIRAKLLECLECERVSTVRHKIGDAVAEVARQYAGSDESWPELLQTLSKASGSSDAGEREIAFRIFATTPDIIERQHEDAVLNVFARGFQDDDVAVRLAAMEAFASFFQSINKPAQKKYFRLTEGLLKIVEPIRNSQDNDQLTRALIALIELAEVSPKMFKDYFHSLVVFSLDVVKDKTLEDTPRQNALELMATFADNAPVMCRKDPEYTSGMVTQCLALMTDVGLDDDDAAEWNASEDLDIDESDMNHVAGEQCMDRLANKLGGETLLAPTFQWIPNMLSSTAWRDRHAALMAISAISEGCREQMEEKLDLVLNMIMPLLKDPQPRVRWAACNALGQMSTDFAGTMQEKYHSVVLPALISCLNGPEARVQAHAAAALVNFCEEAEKEILEPYLNNLVSQLWQLLNTVPQKFVKEQVLSTIATVADSAEVAFAEYYKHLMPTMFEILSNIENQEIRLLRAKAMECATLIALAVGKDVMGQDAQALVQLLGRIQGSITDPDDPQAGYLLHCWGRMCRVLGMEFLPYLPEVVPPLMQLASAKADIQLLDDEEEVARIEGEEGWELVPLKGKFIGINTTTLDDKHTAIELIVIYAQNLEAAFEPYVYEIMEKIALPSLAFFFHDPVRVAAAKAIPQLLNSCKKANGLNSPKMNELWAKTIEKVLEVLSTEPAIETLAEMYQCFYESVEVMGTGCLSKAQMEQFITSAESVLKDYHTRATERAKEANDEDDEVDEEVQMAIEDDQTLLSDMNKAFHTVMKHHTTDFIEPWQRLHEYYTGFVNAADPTQRQWALCIFDDMLEFCGPQSHAYFAMISGPLEQGVRDPEAANRQAAAYGVGVAAQKGGEPWSAWVASMLPALLECCKIPTARSDNDVYATENACASIAKILHFNRSKVPAENMQFLLDEWVATLPVSNDEEAAPYAYSFLIELIQNSNPALDRNPALVFKHMCEALGAETLQGNNAARVVEAAKVFVQQKGVDADAVLQQIEPPEIRPAVRAMF